MSGLWEPWNSQIIDVKQRIGRLWQNPAQSRLENSDMWRSAAHNLQLTESQRKALVQLRLLFMQKQDFLIAQRRAAMAALQSTIPSCASSHDIAAQFLRVRTCAHLCKLSMQSDVMHALARAMGE